MTKYCLFGVFDITDNEGNIDYFTAGLYWILTIGLFPLWIWIYLFYYLCYFIGKSTSKKFIIKEK